MNRSPKAGAPRAGAIPPRRLVVFLAAAVAGLALAALAGLAVAKSFTVNVTKGVSVNGKSEAVASDSKGKTLYTLSGESARPRHLFCTSTDCLGTWPMLTAPSGHPSKAAGIRGKLGVLKRGSVFQVTLNGHPLYSFGPESKGQDSGEGLMIGTHIWHAVKASASSKSTNTMTTTSTTTTTSSSTSTSCLYPPCY